MDENSITIQDVLKRHKDKLEELVAKKEGREKARERFKYVSENYDSFTAELMTISSESQRHGYSSMENNNFDAAMDSFMNFARVID